MNSKLVKDVASKYCYRLVYQGSPEWPNDNTLAGTIKEQITMFCLPLRNLLNSQMTLSTLSNSQKNFVPFLLHILSKLEEEHQSYNSFDVRLPLQKLPSILPRASLHWRFIALNIGSLATFVKEKMLKSFNGFNGQIGMFYRISNFKKLCYKKLKDMLPLGSNKKLFGCIIRTDGYSVDFLFYKKKSSLLIDEDNFKKFNLTLQDFNDTETTRKRKGNRN